MCLAIVRCGIEPFPLPTRRGLVGIVEYQAAETVWEALTVQPMVNLLGIAGTATERVALYFPVSPRLALVLNDVDCNLPLSSSSLTETDVRALNAKIAGEAHTQIFGNSESALLLAHEDSPWRA
jgi:hypothetical protein